MTAWRVAVLGNSHAASLGLAWKAAGGRLPGIASLTVFARPNGQGGLGSLRSSDGVIEADDPQLRQCFLQTAGVDRIDVSAYDAFLIHSFGPEPRLVYSCAASLETHRYSAALMRAYKADIRRSVRQRFDESPVATVVQLLRPTLAQVPVFATHKPLFARSMPDIGGPFQEGDFVYASFQEGVRDSLRGMGCQFLPQPAETVVAGCFTAARFARGDFMHMDGKYGLLVLRDLATALGHKPARPAAPSDLRL